MIGEEELNQVADSIEESFDAALGVTSVTRWLADAGIDALDFGKFITDEALGMVERNIEEMTLIRILQIVMHRGFMIGWETHRRHPVNRTAS